MGLAQGHMAGPWGHSSGFVIILLLQASCRQILKMGQGSYCGFPSSWFPCTQIKTEDGAPFPKLGKMGLQELKSSR